MAMLKTIQDLMNDLKVLEERENARDELIDRIAMLENENYHLTSMVAGMEEELSKKEVENFDFNNLQQYSDASFLRYLARWLTTQVKTRLEEIAAKLEKTNV